MKKIYLAGGCFWGVEHYFSLINGILKHDVGYANSNIANPSYQDVCKGLSTASETVELEYDEEVIDLSKVLKYYFRIIDPTSLNKQGHDEGIQYRTGIYYVDDNDLSIIEEAINELQSAYTSPILVEVMKLNNFYKAEEYHQAYLYKNVNGYCHLPLSIFDEVKKENEVIDFKG